MVISRTPVNHAVMKRLLAFAAFGLLILVTGCAPEVTPKTATKPKELADPELTINGVPGSALESGGSFTFTVTTKSTGEVTVSTNKPTVAAIETTGNLQYKVTVSSLTNVKVKLIASQASDKEYKDSTVEAEFSVNGSGSTEDIPGPDDSVEGVAVTFTEISGDVVNPERGMYSGYEVRYDTSPLTAGVVKGKLTSPGNSLWLLEFYLTNFMTGDIEKSYLDKIQQCFDAVAQGGAKAIVRFAYRWDYERVNIDEQEPKLDILLKHISQIKPILVKNEAVILVLQAGFVGCWGEWYYTTNIKSTSDRKAVVDALLDALPASRQIQLRTPAFKMNLYNLALADTLTAATAHDGTIASRLGGHNDCFLASKNDQGTFGGDTDRQFWKSDTRYTIMGGETCDPLSESNYVYCECSNSLDNLTDYHWTYLHDGYFKPILDRWQTDGCYDEIKSRLGYRLVMKDVHYDAVAAGQKCKVTLRLYNKGFAAPMNPREAWLVWVTPDGKKEKTMLGADPRNWHPGYNAVVGSFTPSTAKGTLYLELSDPLLSDNPAYSIKLANKDVFDATTGMNKLFQIK